MALAVLRLMANSNFVGCSNRYVFRLLALQYSLHKLGAVSKRGRSIGSKRHETTDIDKRARGRSRRHSVLDCHIGHSFDHEAALDDDGIRPFTSHRRKGAVGLLRSADHHDWLDLCVCSATGGQDLGKHGFREYWICSVTQYAHAPRRRHHIAEQFDTFPAQCGGH